MFKFHPSAPNRRLLALGCGFLSVNSAAIHLKNPSPKAKIHPFGNQKRILNILLNVISLQPYRFSYFRQV